MDSLICDDAGVIDQQLVACHSAGGSHTAVPCMTFLTYRIWRMSGSLYQHCPNTHMGSMWKKEGIKQLSYLGAGLGRTVLELVRRFT